MLAGQNLAVIGLGDIGGRLAAQLAVEGVQVTGVRRGTQAPAGVALQRADAASAEQLLALPVQPRWLIACVTPDDYSEAGYRNSYLAIARAVAAWAAQVRPDRIFWVSSTSVFGPGQGEWVDETSPARPQRAQAQVLLEAEQALLAGPCPVTVLRLSGIYGPGRLALLKRVLSGRGVPSTPAQWTNRVHRDDAVAMLHFLLSRAAADQAVPELMLGSDPNPTPRHQVMSWLHEWISSRGLALPPLRPDPDERAQPGRRIRPQALQQMGYGWRYPDYRAGFAAVLEPLLESGELDTLVREGRK